MRNRGVTRLRIAAAALAALALGPSRPAPAGAALSTLSKLDPLVLRQTHLAGRSRVVLRAAGAQSLASVLAPTQLLGGRVLRRLPNINGVALDLPSAAIAAL